VTRVYDLLPEGKENAISTQALIDLLGCGNARELTKYVAQERMEGYPICSSTSGGYYKASTILELRECERSLQSRAMGILVALKPIRRKLKEMEGQQELEITKERP